jgi:hypothetical protein
MQISAKDVVALVIPENVQEQVQVGGDVRETSVVDVDRIEANLEKTVLTIENQTNVVPILVLEEENTNENVELLPKLMEVIY